MIFRIKSENRKERKNAPYDHGAYWVNDSVIYVFCRKNPMSRMIRMNPKICRNCFL
jgi:hypothetical protein